MNVPAELKRAGALISDQHFVYTGGDHGSEFIRLDAILSVPDLLEAMCAELASAFAEDGIEKVTACDDKRCSLLARFCAKALGVESASGDELSGKRTMIAEDVLTSGGSVISLREAAQNYGADVVAAGVIWNRGGVTAEDLGVAHLETLTDISLDSIEEDQCGLCLDGVPIVEDVGQGRRFMHKNPDYKGGYTKILGEAVLL